MSPGLPDPAFWRGRSVLVTGHTGFKGAWLCLWLQALGAEVHGFSDAVASPSLFDDARVGELLASDARGDVRTVGALPQADVVLHLAAQAIVRTSLRSPAETFEVNVAGTARVLDACADASAIVVVTSDKCYANREWVWPYREDDPLGGKDPYSASKAAQELVASAYRQSFGLPIGTARAGNVIGGGDWAADRIVPDAMRAVSAGEPLHVRNPDAVRPWQHVLCPLHGYLLLAEALSAGRAAEEWNFGPSAEDARPVRDVVERLGVDAVLGTAPDGSEAGLLRLDSSKARAGLGWEPRWGLDDGVAATTEWYAGHRDGRDARALTAEQIERYCGT